MGLLLWTGAIANEDGTGSDFSYDNHSERNMVRALEAYAVYKMGNHELAYERFLALAEEGHVQSMLNMANLLEHGLGTEADQRAATTWYARAASAGSEIGMRAYADRLEEGLGTNRDAEAADKWRLMASRLSRGADDRRLASMASVPEVLRARVAALDSAIRRKDADGVADLLPDRSRIEMQSGDAGQWTALDRRGLAALWAAGFARPGRYHYRRIGPSWFSGEDGAVVARSTLLERWYDTEAGAGGRPVFALDVEEILTFGPGDTGYRIERMQLGIQEVQAD